MASSWSFKAGEKGRNRVRVYEDPKRGILAEYYEPQGNGLRPVKRRVVLGRISREDAEQKAKDMAEAFDALGTPPEPELTLGRLFDIYEVEVTPTKSVGKQKHDRACMELFSRFFMKELKGEARQRAAAALRRRGRKGFRWAEACPVAPATINYRHWQRFITERTAGLIAPAQARKREIDGKLRYPPVGPRAAQYDLQFLRAVLSWATIAGEDRGPFLERSPVEGFKLPRNPSPERPPIYEEEYQAMLEAVERTPPRKRRRGTQEAKPTPAELARRRLQLVLLNGQGHRAQSVRHLRWTDFDLAGARVRWAAEHDKQRAEHWTTLSALEVEEIRRARGIIGEVGGWVFPSPVDAKKPMGRSLFEDWFKEAARTAGVERRRIGPHSMRRKAATEMDDTDAAAAAAALGMSVITYLTIYKRPNEQRQREAQAGRRPLRRSVGGQ
jgi:integrase